MPTASSLMMDFDITLKFDFMYARFLDVVDENKSCMVRIVDESALSNLLKIFSITLVFFFLSFSFFRNAPHVLDGLLGLPSRAWQKCNRLLRLGRP